MGEARRLGFGDADADALGLRGEAHAKMTSLNDKLKHFRALRAGLGGFSTAAGQINRSDNTLETDFDGVDVSDSASYYRHLFSDMPKKVGERRGSDAMNRVKNAISSTLAMGKKAKVVAGAYALVPEISDVNKQKFFDIMVSEISFDKYALAHFQLLTLNNANYLTIPIIITNTILPSPLPPPSLPPPPPPSLSPGTLLPPPWYRA